MSVYLYGYYNPINKTIIWTTNLRNLNEEYTQKRLNLKIFQTLQTKITIKEKSCPIFIKQLLTQIICNN